MHQHLDLSAVQAFVFIADLGSFSKAAKALGMTQGGVSLKLRRLEKTLDRRLVDRTPRHVRLSPDGEGFLPRARDLLAAQEFAFSASRRTRHLALGVSEYIAGWELPGALTQLASQDPSLVLEVKVGKSRDLLNAYDQRELDAVIVRQDACRTDGEVLFDVNFGWFSAPVLRHHTYRPAPLITVADTPPLACVRAIALRTLAQKGVPSKDVFIGSGIPAVIAALSAGLGVAPLPLHLAPPGAIEVGKHAELPELPPSKAVLFNQIKDHRTRQTLRVFISAVCDTGARRTGYAGRWQPHGTAGGLKVPEIAILHGKNELPPPRGGAAKISSG